MSADGVRSGLGFRKIAVIEGSLRCFVNGCVGMIPVVGVPFACVAIRAALNVRECRTNTWNPASRYLVAGWILAWTGLLLTTVTLAGVALNIVDSASHWHGHW